MAEVEVQCFGGILRMICDARLDEEKAVEKISSKSSGRSRNLTRKDFQDGACKKKVVFTRVILFFIEQYFVVRDC
jgi:hypothetical protein